MSAEFVAWFYVFMCFFIFTYMLLASIYFPKIEKPWFKKWWDIYMVRVIFAYGSLTLFVLMWILSILQLPYLEER